MIITCIHQIVIDNLILFDEYKNYRKIYNQSELNNLDFKIEDIIIDTIIDIDEKIIKIGEGIILELKNIGIIYNEIDLFDNNTSRRKFINIYDFIRNIKLGDCYINHGSCNFYNKIANSYDVKSLYPTIPSLQYFKSNHEIDRSLSSRSYDSYNSVQNNFEQLINKNSIEFKKFLKSPYDIFIDFDKKNIEEYQNIIIINKRLKEIERFDPNQSEDSILDKNL